MSDGKTNVVISAENQTSGPFKEAADAFAQAAAAVDDANEKMRASSESSWKEFQEQLKFAKALGEGLSGLSGGAHEAAAAEHELKEAAREAVEYHEMLHEVIEKGKEAFSEIKEAVLETAEAEEAAYVAAERLGVSVENFSTLSAGALQAGVSAGVLEKAMFNLEKNVVSDGRDMTQLFIDAAKQVAAIEDPTERAKRATELFGKAARELGPFLEDLAKNGFDNVKERAKAYGLVLTDVEGKTGHDLVVATDKAKGALAGLNRELLEIVKAPVQEYLDTWAYGFAELGRQIAAPREEYAKLFGVAKEAQADNGLVGPLIDAGEAAVRTRKEVEALEKAREKAARAHEAALKHAAENEAEWAAAAKKAADEVEKAANKYFDDFMKRSTEALKFEEQGTKAQQALAKEARDMKAREAGAEEAAQTKILTEQERKTDQLASKMGGDLANAAGSFTKNLIAGKNVFDDLAKAGENFAIKLEEIAIKAAAVAAFKALLGGATGGASSVIGELFGAAEGGVAHNGRIERMASGGVLSGGTPGVDSIPVLAMEGEGFISAPTTRALQRELGVSGGQHFADGGVVSGGSRGGDLHVHVMNATTIPPNTTQSHDTLRYGLLPALDEMKRNGMFDEFLRRP